MNKYLLLSTSLLTIGCADSTFTSPSRTTLTHTVLPSPVADKPVVPEEDCSIKGLTGHHIAPTSEWIEWTIPCIPADMELEGAYDWTDDDHAQFVNTGGKHTRMLGNGNFYFTRIGTTITLKFRLSTFNCGSIQIDFGRKFNHSLIFTLVLWYPLCKPTIQTDCWKGLTPISVINNLDHVLFTYRIEDGFSVDFFLGVFYYLPNSSNLNRWGVHLPQRRFDYIQRTREGGVYTDRLSVPLHFQADGRCGKFLPEEINESNVEEFDRELRMWAVNTPDGVRDSGMRLTSR
jgi:hypothetical protein